MKNQEDPKIQPLTREELLADQQVIAGLIAKYQERSAAETRALGKGYHGTLIGGLQTAARLSGLLAELPAESGESK